MISLKKLSAVLAFSLPLVAAAQPAAEPPPAAPPAAAPAPTAPAPAPAAAPAAAKPPLAQIYGTLNVNFQFEEAPNPTTRGQNVRGRFGLSPDSSNVGVRGTADTGMAGIGVVYQCETTANIDNVGVSGICNRNSRIGVSSPYGTLFYGNWDSPYKAAWYGTKADDAFGNTDVYDATAIMGSPGFNTKSTNGNTNIAIGSFVQPNFAGTTATTSTTFAVRASDSVVYHSPKVMGASFKAQYSANRFSDNKDRREPELYSAVVNYEFGPFSVLGAYEDHEDWLTQRSRDFGWKAGAGYELGSPFGTTTVGAVYEQLKFRALGGTSLLTSPAGAVKEFKRPAVMANVKHRMGNHEFRARFEYADAGDCKVVSGATCPTKGLGAKDYALGYAYYLSKAAQVYAYWTRVENERLASYTFSTAGFAAIAGATPVGSDPWALGLGMRYAF